MISRSLAKWLYDICKQHGIDPLYLTNAVFLIGVLWTIREDISGFGEHSFSRQLNIILGWIGLLVFSIINISRLLGVFDGKL